MVNLSPTAVRRLSEEHIAWLTTVRSDGSPATRPIWFVWEAPQLLVYSEPHVHKIRHLIADPCANIHFNTDAEGGSVVVLDVEAVVEPDAPPPSQCPGYADKYGKAILRLGTTVPEYDRRFTTLIRLRVHRSVDTNDTLGSD